MDYKFYCDPTYDIPLYLYNMNMYIFSAFRIYIFFGFFLFIFQRRILFNVSGIPQELAYYGLNNIEIIKIITSDDVGLLTWFSKSKTNKSTLIYLQGNSFDIGESI